MGYEQGKGKGQPRRRQGGSGGHPGGRSCALTLLASAAGLVALAVSLHELTGAVL